METTRDMEVHYQDLAPEDYRFEVTEADQSGHQFRRWPSLSFQITPRWWQNQSLQIWWPSSLS